MNLSLDRIRANRNFANKIWNAARFTVTNLGKLAGEGDGLSVNGDQSQDTTDHHSLADRWIASRLNATIVEATRLFDSYQFGEAGRQAYEFLWGDFADWYIEAAKGQLAAGGPTAAQTAGMLVHVLDQTLRLLHPFIPFVTEDIWQNLKAAAEAASSALGPVSASLSPLGPVSDRARLWPEALIIAPWPQAGPADAETEAAFGRVQEIVRAIRNARAEYNVPPGRRIGALISAGEHLALVQAQLPLIANLASLDSVHVQLAESLAIPAKSANMVAGGVVIALPLADLVDLDAEIARLRKELANAEKMAGSTSARLANPGFVASAPAHVVEGARQQLAEWEGKKAQIQERLAAFGGLEYVQQG
jgi:valyl-tRNA synthetase